MKKKDLLELLNDIEEDGVIDEILQETDLYKSSLTLDNFKQKVATDDSFKKYMESSNDKHFDKALKTWKANNLEKLIEAEVLKRTGKTETPEQKAIRELQEQLANMGKEKEKAERIAKYKDVLVKKKIPSQLSDFILGEDDDVTEANINIFEDAMKTYVESKVKERLKDSKYTPPKSGEKKMTRDEFNKLTLVEKQKLYDDNPNILDELG